MQIFLEFHSWGPTTLQNEREKIIFVARKNKMQSRVVLLVINPFAPGDFAEKRLLKLVERFSGHYHAIKS